MTNDSPMAYDGLFKRSFKESYRELRKLFDDSRLEDPDLRFVDALARADQAIKSRIEQEFLHRGNDRLHVNHHLQSLPDHFLSSTKAYAKNHLANFMEKVYPAWIDELRLHHGKTFKNAPHPRSLLWNNERVVRYLAFRCAAHRVRNNYASILSRSIRPNVQPCNLAEESSDNIVDATEDATSDSGTSTRLSAKQASILLYCLLSDARWDVSGTSASKMREFLAAITSYSTTTLKPHVEWLHTVATRYEVPTEVQKCAALREDIARIKFALDAIGRNLPEELVLFDNELEEQITDKKAKRSKKK